MWLQWLGHWTRDQKVRGSIPTAGHVEFCLEWFKLPDELCFASENSWIVFIWFVVLSFIFLFSASSFTRVLLLIHVPHSWFFSKLKKLLFVMDLLQRMCNPKWPYI